MTKYDHKKIEEKWQSIWQKEKIYQAADTSKKPKKYVLIEFPYPSGEGLHMGHLRPYTAGDVYARFNRMNGHEVLYPIGWDAFGLPAENFALKKGVHPRVSTAKNIENAKKQLQSWGLSFDWSREVNTTDPAYYKWTQWIFLQFYNAGLAYEATGLINWCPSCKTGLANEEVVNGVCERCGTKVEKKEMRQWYLKITAYAEKLLEGLKDLIEWTEPVKLQQANWIGKSEGAELEFELSNKFNYVLLHGYNGTHDGIFFKWLKKELDKRGLKYQAPQLPNPDQPTEDEQVSFVLQNCNFDDETILFGHSLGSVVAMKVLEKLDRRIAGLVLAGGFVEHNFKDRPRSFDKTFKWSFDFEKIKKQTGFVKILSDPTDHAVPLEQGRILAERLHGELIEESGDKPHFTSNEEPLILTTLLYRIVVFTTRPDTLFGATYMVLAPEHSLVSDIRNQITNIKEVDSYIEMAGKKTEIQRTAEDKEKTGVELKGIKAINPATKEEIPVWVADYVLMGYGTGAIMAVPAHDERDFQFAKKYNLPIRQVVQNPLLISQLSAAGEVGNFLKGGEIRALEGSGSPPFKEGLGEVFSGEGKLLNSGEFDGMKSEQAIKKITKKFGKPIVQYKLRDWVFSRQRYWGEPIPIIHCEKCGIVPVPEKDLPVVLPQVEKYEPTGTGESPLAAIEDWVNVKCPNCEGPAKRETNTMPQWAGSSWYWLRFADPGNEKEFASKKLLKYWQPVDVYFGGMEHTTLHLLYSRFWNLFMFDRKLVTEKEPYVKRVPHGIVLASDGEKMSKSRGNVVNPDNIVEKYGADTMRMYEMFLGPHDATVSWNDKGILGVKRFLDKVYRHSELVSESSPKDSSLEVLQALNRFIKKITEDIEAFKFNTAIAAFMEFLHKNQELNKSDWEEFLKLLAPFAPHLTEELWEKLDYKESIHKQDWPAFDKKLIKDETVVVVIQVNGKVRANIEVAAGTNETEVKEKAKDIENVKKYLDDKQIIKEIFVADKLINFVVK